MSNAAAQLVRLPMPSSDIVEEFGQDLYVGRRDPCDPKACFNFLFDLYPERWREVLANWEAASYHAGQMYIDAAKPKIVITQDNAHG